MKVRILFATLVLLLTLALGSVACGGGDDDDGASPAATGQDGGNDGQDTGGAGGDDDGPTDPPDPTIPPNLGEEITLEEYFTAIEGVFEAADAATDDAEAELNAALASDESLDGRIEADQNYVETVIEVFSDAIGRLDVLNSPDEIEQDHDGFIQAVTEAATAAIDFQFALDDIDTEEELDVLESDFGTEVNEITARADEACFNLQDFADANSIDVDLTCED